MKETHWESGLKKQKGTGKKNTNDKRRRIIQAAVRVFAHKGYSLAKISDIANQAKVATGTVYIYFESKDDLLQHCMNEVISTKLDAIKAMIDPGIPAIEQLYLFS